MYVDLGVERLLAAEKGKLKIAVEVKSFTGPSDLADLEDAIGQYILYQSVLTELDPDRPLYLAVPDDTMRGIFSEEIGQILLRHNSLNLVGFDVEKEELTQWIPLINTVI